MRTKTITLLLILPLLITSLGLPATSVQADSSVTTADMIAMVNSWRTGIYGHQALVESAALDACAQATADTMAAIEATTHLVYLGYPGATARCANYGFGGGKTVFVTENWAMHTSMTLNILGDYWSDAAHQLPASSQQYVYVGAGIASNSAGETYYVLQAGNISGETTASDSGGGTVSSGGGTTPEATSDTSQYMSPVITSTPNYDGYVYHTVQSGQTLFQIALAYGVTLDYLKELNSLSDETMIYTGQTLKIMQAATPTVTPTFTPTPVYPTRTPSPAEITATPTLMPTPTATPVPTFLEKLPTLDRQTFGFLLVVLSALGLAVVVVFTLIKPGRNSASAQAPAPQPIAPEPETPKKKRAPKKSVESVEKITEAKAAPVKARTKKQVTAEVQLVEPESTAPAAKKSSRKPKAAAESAPVAETGEEKPPHKPHASRKKTEE
jgi:LysM repeat protein